MCLECKNMICRVFNVKSEAWTGFCSAGRCKVSGQDECHLPRQPTNAKELDLSFSIV